MAGLERLVLCACCTTRPGWLPKSINLMDPSLCLSGQHYLLLPSPRDTSSLLFHSTPISTLNALVAQRMHLGAVLSVSFHFYSVRAAAHGARRNACTSNVALRDRSARMTRTKQLSAVERAHLVTSSRKRKTRGTSSWFHADDRRSND